VRSVIAIFGPTGVGKTAATLALADRLRARGERPLAVSADALQVYRGLELLTGAPTAAERARLEHRLVGVRTLDETFSVGEFMPLAHRAIDDCLAADGRPIVVGGTGLYLRAALTDLGLRPPAPPAVRARVEGELAARGPAALHAELERRAPAVGATIEPTDRVRVVRALELLEMGEDPSPGDSELWTGETRRPTLLCGLVMERDELYRRIDARVDRMVAAGAREQVRRAEAAGASETARNALGYRELLRGDVDAMKRRTRQYAKRQLTWMRKLPDVRTIDATGRSPEAVAEALERLLER
jgi:tRNA dimethylallyltransferase